MFEEELLQILLVDDDVTDRMNIERMLEKSDVPYELTEAVDVGSALAALQSRDFDIALVDYRLPDGSALDVLEQIHSGIGMNALPVIILTGLTDQDTVKETLRHGAEDYLVKGNFDQELLLRSMAYAIQRRRGDALRNQLMHADRMAAIGELSAGIAHEINSPATFIISNLKMLQENLNELEQLLERAPEHDMSEESDPPAQIDALLEESREMVEDNLSGIERISSVVKDLGVFSRFDDGEVEWVDVGEVIESACKLVHNQFRHRATLIKDLGKVEKIPASAGRLGQVFTNLLMNAAQAIPEGDLEHQRIRVKTQQKDGAVEVTVEDTGVGIPPNVLRRVFDPFFTTKPQGEGTGLGLAISAQIIEAHSGDIHINSTEGVGTTIRVTLPIENGLIPLSEAQPDDEIAVEERLKPRVLIVDDETMLLKSFRRALEPTYEIVTESVGQRAIDLLEVDSDFDVILCDVMMPNVDGIEIYEKISKQLPHLLERVVFMSGGGYTDRTKRFLQSVAAPVLEKPVEPEQVASCIDELCHTIES